MTRPTPRGRSARDAVVVGAGPNGLAAAIALARAGRSVLVLEAEETVGGGARSAELTLPGLVHDVCSSVHPLAAASPFLRTLPLGEHGLELVHPDAPLAHPLDGGEAVLLERSLDATAAGLGADGRAYRSLFAPLVREADALLDLLLGPFPLPRRPLLLARFGLNALLPAERLARWRFDGVRARALFAGIAAHSIQPLGRPATAAFGLVLGLIAHAYGWPFARGGSQRVSDALAGHLRALGGDVETGVRVASLDELPPARALLLDVTPKQLLDLAGGRLPARYAGALRRFRYGPGVFKVDWALDGPIPWAAEECARAGTVHLGGTLEEIVESEADVWAGRHPARPFVLLAQATLFDRGRAPEGRHTGWAYCHVPHGSTEDLTEAVELQVERFAPGFRERILARRTHRPADLERYDANYVGGDINGGVQDLRQLWTRPVVRLDPYATPVPGLYLCSSSTPPGGGVHGMCGYHAARSALRHVSYY